MDAIRARLSARRQELQARLRRVDADQRREIDALSADAPDQAIQRENDEVIDSIALTTGQELAAIDAALSRLDSGQYGICQNCHYPIEPKRLAAVPYASRCQRCASEPGARATNA